mgnify:CR=1 FL=1
MTDMALSNEAARHEERQKRIRSSLARRHAAEKRFRLYGLVAIGMALIAADLLPHYGGMIMAMAIGTTIAFELVGPVIAAVTLNRVARGMRDGRE